MRTPPSALLPLLRSRLQGDLLALTYLHPDREYSISELAALVDATVKNVHNEVSRLVEHGLLLGRKVGNVRLVRAALDHPLVEPLTDLMALTYGPLPVLTELLSPIEGILEAYIYGSWAARYLGQVGPPPNDVDVLVVGKPKRHALDDAAEAARELLQREVNVHRMPTNVWKAEPATDPFIQTVKSRPLVQLKLEGVRREA